MKKFGILLLSLCVATPALADFWTNCTTYGGTIVTANSYGNDKGGKCHDPNDPNLTTNCNGKRFCRGGTQMNWWSAFNWCDSIGGQLTRLESICPAIHPDSGGYDECPNARAIVTDNNRNWTSAGWGTNRALYVFLGDWGCVDNNSAGRTGTHTPLCEEK